MVKCRAVPLLVLLSIPWLCTADDPPWETLPFRMKPLVQEGSANLAPQIGTPLEGWDARGDAAAQTVEGKTVVRLGPKRGEDYASVRAQIDAKPSTLYSVSFQVKFLADAEFNYEDSYPGLHGWIAIRGEDGTPCSWRIRDQRRGPNWREYRAHAYTTRAGKRLDLSIAFKGVKGAALINDVDVHEDRAPKDAGRQVILPPETPQKPASRFPPALYDYAEVPRQTEPPRPGSVTVFHRQNADRLFFYSHPTRDEIGAPVSLALTPGELGVTTAAVFTPRTLPKLRPVISIDKGFRGKIQWQVVQYHPRRIDFYGRGRTWHWVPDFFLTRPDGIDAEANRTHVFWIKVQPGADAKPGAYKGSIAIESAGQKIGELPFRVTVRPFKLVDANDKVWGMYPDAHRWKKMTDEQVLRELKDLQDHAVQSLHVPVRGKPVFDGDNATGWEFDETDRRLMGLVKKSGVRGPHLVWFGWLDKMLISRMKLPPETRALPPEQRPEKLTKAYEQCLAAFKKEFEKLGWGEPGFIGVDEPGYWKKGSPEQFLWEMKAATSVGWKTYCTSSYLPSDPIGRMLTYHCYGGGGLVNPERAERIRRETHAAGQQFWYYRTGCYSGEVGNMARNRYYSGFMFFRSKADGSVSWTFQRARGNAFDDFYAQKSGQACIPYPDPEHPGENLDTPHWEGLRQGWIDYRYAATLASLAQQHPEAANKLDAVLRSMPWNGDVFMGDDVNNHKCDQWRAQIAALIEKYGKKD